MRGRGPVLSLLFLAAFCSAAISASAEEAKDAPEEPIRITSDQLEADKGAGIVTFSGNVVVKQKDAIIMSETLTVYYDKNRRMEKIIARGDVRITQQGRVGTCQKATYYPGEDRIVMEEYPRLWRDGDMVAGDLITIYLGSDRMSVKGATATIYRGKRGKTGALPARGGSDR